MITNYHAKYFGHELTRQRPSAGVDRLSVSLFDACVDLNPHQIDASAERSRVNAASSAMPLSSVGTVVAPF